MRSIDVFFGLCHKGTDRVFIVFGVEEAVWNNTNYSQRARADVRQRLRKDCWDLAQDAFTNLDFVVVHGGRDGNETTNPVFPEIWVKMQGHLNVIKRPDHGM